MLLAQISRVDNKELCRLDVLDLSDTPINDQGNVHTECQEQLTRGGEEITQCYRTTEREV